MQKLRIVVGGFVGLFPAGGATLDYVQYPVGLRLLGHDVYYIEDTNLYPVYQPNKAWDDASDCILYLEQTMKHFGLEGKWAYRDVASGKCYGMSLEKVLEVCKTADVFLNLSCSTFMRDEYFRIPNRILLDSDPMFTQIQYHDEKKERKGNFTTKEMIESHNYLFSFGENIGNGDCRIPTLDLHWRPTRQPICLTLWENKADPVFHFTSIMNWSGRNKLCFDNEEWGQKDVEFVKYIQLPDRVPSARFQIVINPPLHPESTYNPHQIKASGWQVLKPEKEVSNFTDYKKFIQTSFAEFSIAKETYVKSNSGWFPCRSACYLAAGRPVVTQETGWSAFVPSGSGLFSFTCMEQAAEAINEIMADYKKHAKAALEVGRTYFDSRLVLNQMLEQLN